MHLVGGAVCTCYPSFLYAQVHPYMAAAPATLSGQACACVCVLACLYVLRSKVLGVWS